MFIKVLTMKHYVALNTAMIRLSFDVPSVYLQLLAVRVSTSEDGLTSQKIIQSVGCIVLPKKKRRTQKVVGLSYVDQRV